MGYLSPVVNRCHALAGMCSTSPPRFWVSRTAIAPLGSSAHSVTREHVGWLRAYAAQRPERVIILSETEGTWMSALLDYLPPGADDPERVLAWMRAPYDLPPAAGLRSSASLGELLDTLGAPPPAAMS